MGAGFYGNSEANDGVYQLLYALDNANHTFSGIDVLVRSRPGSQARPARSAWSPQTPRSDPASSTPRGLDAPWGCHLVPPGADRPFLFPRQGWE